MQTEPGLDDVCPKCLGAGYLIRSWKSDPPSQAETMAVCKACVGQGFEDAGDRLGKSHERAERLAKWWVEDVPY